MPPTASAAVVARPAALSGVLYADPSSSPAAWVAANPSDRRTAAIKTKIVGVPTARWFLQATDAQYVANYVGAAASAGRVPLLVAYDIPLRDCGSYSAGGASSSSAYQSWIRQFAAGIGRASAVVLLEPDSLYYSSCLTAAQLTERLRLLNDAVAVLRAAAPNAVVYLDGGTPVHGTTVAQMASLLKRAGVAGTRGFAVNINNFKTEDVAHNYAASLRTALTAAGVSGSHFLIDTSRNGRQIADTLWCNPSGAAVGARPAWNYGTDGLDGNVWFKHPGESDGACGSAAASTSGQFVPDLAYALATN
ncbi:endoglucanase [Nakamurella panacisegetis]|uniref:Glucanase n=1 Tax=Nakamurella panacisegetis TaxID=1090615 RepID=A0A1H0LZ85_9ACTN|nr:glycoside hydrolase family 6 protein [Nakamurella panacisegetis]SDO73552.1 endoglucanase [Nakamurella panacisegetis]